MNRFVRFAPLFLSLAPYVASAGVEFDALNEAMHTESGLYSAERDDTWHLGLQDEMEARDYLASYLGEASRTNPNTDPLKFSHACDPGRRFVIGAVGDVLLHKPLAVQGLADGFRSLWSSLEGEFKRTGVMYANLEGPTAGPVGVSGRPVADPGRRFDGVAYSSYPRFNYHPSLVADLSASGIDVVSTANNHACDRRSLGVDRTIEALEDERLAYTGTRTAREASENPPENTNWTTVTEQGGFRIGWIACTFSTNGIPDSERQVLLCFQQRSIVLDQIRALHADPTIDAVIVTPHWGLEYEHVPGRDQRSLARDFIEAGALIVLGGHPHVLQPADKIVASDGREGYVIYSLGNFVSGQKGLARRTSALVFVGLTKTPSGEVYVNGTRHLPLAMNYTGEGIQVQAARGTFEAARVLANRVLSRSREITPGEALVTNPECGR